MSFEYIQRNMQSTSASQTSGSFTALQQEAHEIYVLEPEEVLAIHVSNQIEAGKLSLEQADKIIKGASNKGTDEEKKALAQYIFSPTTSYTLGNVGTWQSAVVLQRMVRDFGGLGEILIKETNGKQYVIFKGYPGLRKIITGTRYLVTNPKVVAMGIGRVGMRNVIQSGARITFIAMLGYRFLEYLLVDKVTLGQLIGNLASDVVKVAVGVGASYIVMGMAGMTVAALGPLVVAIIAGIAISAGLDYLDNQLGLTAKMSDAIDTMLNDIAREVADQRDSLGQKFQYMAYSAFEIAATWLIRQGTDTVVSYIRRNINYFMGPR